MRHLRTYLLVTLLALAVGQVAMATNKTVKYCITGVTQNGTSYTLTFGLAEGSDTPFDGSTTYGSVTVNTSTATDKTVTLGDGFSLRLQWAAGSSSDRVNIADTGYGWNINANNTYVTYTVLFSSNRYFATHFDMQNSQGNEWMSDTGGHVIAPDFNYVSQLEQSYDSRKMFGRLVVKYTDMAPITVLTSPSANTYNITSQHDLAVLASYVNGGGNTSGLTFLQTADIIFTTTTAWNDASGQENNYTAIGTSSHRFQGTFDGQNHTIRDIRIYQGGNNSADDYQGLFGCIGSGGTVKRVDLDNVRITGHNSVGGIAGGLFTATVEDCIISSSGIHSVQNSSSHGGIVGYSEGTIQRCISNATLSAANTGNCEGYGAIVGKNKNSVIDCIAVNATVPGIGKAGAIIGYDSSTPGTIQRNYYCTCTAAGTENATGVGVGYDSSNTLPHDITTNQGALAVYSLTLPTNVTLVRTASTILPYGKTYDNGADIGGTSCAYATASIQLSYTGAPPAGEYALAVYVNDVIATDNGNYTYTATMPAEDVTVSYGLVAIPWRGNGTADSPWLIERREQLDLLATNVNGGNDYHGKYFLQTADLFYDGTENNFVPIGDAIFSDSDPHESRIDLKPGERTTSNGRHVIFSGTYDGGGHTISGIRVTRTGTLETSGYIGLFSMVEGGGTVKNVVLANSTFTAFRYVGGIAGLCVGTIQNCRVKDDVTIGASDPGTSSLCLNYGGIAGFAQGSVIGCISAAALNHGGFTSPQCFGGIVGRFAPKVAGDGIRNCLYTGTTIPASSHSGAIAGLVQFGALYDNNYYTSASVPGGVNGSDVDGKAELAATYNFRPVEIGEQTDSYAGLTADELLIAYEHGLSYKGVYYMSNSTPASTAVLTLVQGTKDGVSAYWGTFYDGTRRNTLPEGAAAYTMDAEHHLYRLGDDGRVIPAGVAVVIIADRASITLTPNTDGSTITDHAPDYVNNTPTDGNILYGGPVTPDSEHKVPVPGTTGKGFPYVLSVDDNGTIGFRKYTGTDAIPANKAYYAQ